MRKFLLFGFLILSITVRSQYQMCLGDVQAICPYENVTIKICDLGNAETNPNDSTILAQNLSMLNPDDDVYSAPINIGFPFTFYGTVYNQCLISSNGYISFNLDSAYQYSTWYVASSAPNPYTLPTNAIFGVFEDIDPLLGGTIDYGTIGTAPNRIFVVRYANVPLFDDYYCPDQSYCGSILLFEGSNNIEVHIYNKPLCFYWNDGAAIEGVVNKNGTNAAIVAGRNYPQEWISSLDGKRFTPNTGNAYLVDNIPYKRILTPKNIIDSTYLADSIKWYSIPGNNLVGHGLTYTISPLSYPFPIPADDTIKFYPEFPCNLSPDSNCDVSSNVNLQYATVFIKQQPHPILIIQNIDCHTTGGTLTITNGPFESYLWSNDSTSVGISNISAGTYSVTVSEMGCTGANTATIDSFYMASIIKTTNDTCNAHTGAIEVITTGNTAPYSYIWNANVDSFFSPNYAAYLSQGTFSVTITDSFACTDSFTIYITATGTPAPDSMAPVYYCVGTDSVPLNISGQSINFYNNSTGGTPLSTPIYPNTTSPGNETYWVSQTINGCESSRTPIEVDIHAPPVINFAQLDSMVCSDSSIILLNTESNTGYIWVLYGNSVSTSVNGSEIILWDSGSTIETINITAFDTLSGCSVTTSVSISFEPKPSAVIVYSDTVLCIGETITLSSSQNGNNYWSTGENSDSIFITQNGIYSLVTAANGCSSDTAFANINFLPFIFPEMLTTDTTIKFGESIQLAAINSSNDSALAYIWTPANSLNCVSCSTVFATPVSSTTYYVSLNYPCTGIDSVNIIVDQHKEFIWMPNAFTPNGDGNNDRIYPFYYNELGALKKFDIFNRWGELVYSNATEGWDGMYKGVLQPAGVYTYYVSILTINNKTLAKQGSFLLLR